MSVRDVEAYDRHMKAAQDFLHGGQLDACIRELDGAAASAHRLSMGSVGPIADGWRSKHVSVMSLKARISKTALVAGASGPAGEPPAKESGRVSDPRNPSILDRGKQFALREKPSQKLDDVAGLDDVKRELRESVIDATRHSEIYARFGIAPGAGILMYGPPGNGKTYIAKAIAGELDASFFVLDPATVKGMYVGDTEKNMAGLFEVARQESRSVIFIDECDALLKAQQGENNATVQNFLQLADGIKSHKSCMVLLGATNKPWDLDPAVLRPGRLGTHIYVGPPDLDARVGILKHHFKASNLAEDVSLADIAGMIAGFSGADIKALADKANKASAQREIRAGGGASGVREKVTRGDIEQAAGSMAPSVTSEQIEQYHRWRMDRKRPV